MLYVKYLDFDSNCRRGQHLDCFPESFCSLGEAMPREYSFDRKLRGPHDHDTKHRGHFLVDSRYFHAERAPESVLVVVPVVVLDLQYNYNCS